MSGDEEEVGDDMLQEQHLLTNKKTLVLIRSLKILPSNQHIWSFASIAAVIFWI